MCRPKSSSRKRSLQRYKSAQVGRTRRMLVQYITIIRYRRRRHRRRLVGIIPIICDVNQQSAVPRQQWPGSVRYVYNITYLYILKQKRNIDFHSLRLQRTIIIIQVQYYNALCRYNNILYSVCRTIIKPVQGPSSVYIDTYTYCNHQVPARHTDNFRPIYAHNNVMKVYNSIIERKKTQNERSLSTEYRRRTK